MSVHLLDKDQHLSNKISKKTEQGYVKVLVTVATSEG